jgi:hypothetical protein
VIDAGHKAQGAGITDKIEKGADGKINIIVPAEITSREKLGEYLVKDLGIKRNTKEFMESYAKYGKELPAVDPK